MIEYIVLFLVILAYIIVKSDVKIENFETKTDIAKKIKETRLIKEKSKYKIPSEEVGKQVKDFPTNNYFTISSDGNNLDIEYDKVNKLLRAVVKPIEVKKESQLWYYTDGKIVNKSNHVFLTLYSDVKADGIPVHLTTEKKTNGQYWLIDDEGVIRCRLSGGKLSYHNKQSEYLKQKKSKLSGTDRQKESVNSHVFLKLGKGLNTGYNQKWILTTKEVIDDTPAPIDPIINDTMILEAKKNRNINFLKKLKKIL